MKHVRRPALAKLAAAIQSALCAGLAFSPSVQAAAPAFGSPAWIAQRAGSPNGLSSATGAVAAPSAGIPGAVSTPQQALVQAKRSVGDLARAAQAITQAQAAQTAARQLALTMPNPADVAEGLAANGLQVATGVPRDLANPLAGDDASLWQNAALPTQAKDGGHTTVTVKQNAAKAILTWNSFNVGRDTTLHFDQRQGKQSDGSNEWVALNRVTDPSAKPSRILGQIDAEGSVYLINRNGIVFGGASQVNTHSLIASSLAFLGDDKDLGASNRQFLSGGILPNGTVASTVLGLGAGDTVELADFKAGGDIRVEAGARIKTGDSGFSLLAAPQLFNAGTIEATKGQVILAAGIGVQLSGSTLASASTPSTNPTGVLSVELQGSVLKDGANVTPVGVLTQSGLVSSDRGNVTLVGSRIDQLGVVAASTSLTRPGTIVIRASEAGQSRVGLVRFGSDSVTTVLPIDDGSTTTSGASSNAAFTTGSVSVFGGAVDLDAGALIEAPGANVSFTALTDPQFLVTSALDGAVNGRVYIDHDATIDVAGLADVELSASSNRVTIPRIGQNELANAPLQRLGLLFGQRNVVIDASITGTRDDGLSWVGSPVLNVQGYVDLVPRRIDQFLTRGGNLSFNTDEALITRSGSLLNLDGGYVNYLPGLVQNTTRLLGADGKVYDISQARTDIDYVGIAGSFDLAHTRWNQTDSFVDPLVSGAGNRFDPGHVAGAQAGSLSVSTRVSALIEGDVSAKAVAGRDQVAAAALPKGGTLSVQAGAVNGSVVFQSGRPQIDAIAAGFDATTSLATPEQLAKADTDRSKVLVWTPISTVEIADAGFSTVNVNAVAAAGDTVSAVTTGVAVAHGATLAVARGGAVNLLVGSSVNIEGAISAPSGNIDISTLLGVTPANPEPPADGGDISVAAGARLSTAGTWVNDSGLAADDRTGRAGINGGSIRLTTDIGHIGIGSGSVLDVSGGGYVDANGNPRQTDQVLAGRAGSLSLQNYVASGGATGIVPSVPDSRTGIKLAGQVKSHGFGAGGTFTLQALNLQIGGSAPAESTLGTTLLDPAFFAEQGFGAYALNGIFGAEVAAGTQVTVSTRNALPDLPVLLATATGSPLVEGMQYRLGRLDDTRRAAADFSLNSSGATLRVGEAAAITTDAGADLTLSAHQLTMLGRLVDHGGAVTLSGPPTTNGSGAGAVWLGGASSIDVSGTTLIDPLAAPERLNDGSSVTPRVGRVLDGGSIALRYDGGYVVAQAGSVIDVSGGADRLDLPLAAIAADGRTTAPQAVWSDAGSIELQASSGLYMYATLRGHGGNTSARGGSLRILPSRAAGLGTPATAVVVQAEGSAFPAGAEPGAPVEPGLEQPSGKLFFAADRLRNSGITDLVIGRQANGDAASAAVPIVFSGNVSLALSRSIELNAPAYTTADADSSDASLLPEQAIAVHLSAPYVAIDGYAPAFGNAAAAATSDGRSTFAIEATQIDLGGRFTLDHFASSRLTASGDIRFSTELGGFDATTGAAIVGQLKTAGDLRFEAAQLYPATANSFAVIASGNLDLNTGAPQATTITVAGNAASATSAAPLSAGGSLLFDATNIVQGGVLRAPGGQIVLGLAAGDTATAARFDAPEVVATASVVAEATSRTSVSLEGLTVPYGSTVDGIDWKFNPQNQGTTIQTADLTAPPAKRVLVSAGSVALQKGAVIDVSGGGDLQASEWVAGTGGSRDVLARYNTDRSGASGAVSVPLYADGRKVFAILPGAQAPVAATDPSFGASKVNNIDHLTDLPAVGQQVTLTGIAGLAAGTYTLLPAEYATLPGAYRIVQDTGSIDAFAGNNLVKPDGTFSVAGRFTDTLSGASTARTTRFEVQSRAVWQQYSEYRFSSANTYFAALATKNGDATPPLPVDAGQLAIGATQALALGATLNAAGAKGGAAAEVDIASQDIQIVAGAQTPRLDGYLQIDAADLNAIGAGSLLIGGTRSHTADGTQIDPLASSVVVSNDSASALSGPEIVFTTRTDPTFSDANAANGLRFDAGSVVRAEGAVAGSGTARYLIGRVPDLTTGDSGSAGDGALMRVSNGTPALVTRRNLSDMAGTALLHVRAGATLAGGASLTLDASGDVRLDPSATVSGKAIDANSSQVNFVGGVAAGQGLAGLVVGPATLAQFAAADVVTLRSRGSMAFVGPLDLQFAGDLTLGAGGFVGDGSDVGIGARQLTLDNALHAPSPGVDAAPSGTLTVKAATLVFGSGTSGSDAGAAQAAQIAGFARIDGSASVVVTSAGRSSFDVGSADLTLSAPVFIAGAGADASLRSSGAVALRSGAGTAPADAPLGGAFTLIGGSLESDAAFVAPSGKVTLQATTGDLTLASGARIDVAGRAQAFYDLTRYTPGGAIALTANAGRVRLATGSTLDFSGAVPPSSANAPAGEGGDAGSLAISAPRSTVDLGATLLGGAAASARGGSFAVEAGGALDLDALAAALATSGVDRRIAVRSGSGNLMLSSGKTLTASDVQLLADGGLAAGQPVATDGHVEIDGRIDASGASGGSITLYGRNGVAINGSLLATASGAGERGGDVVLGTSAFASGEIDAATGREVVLAAGSGAITLGAQSLIDVSAHGQGGAGGTVSLRAPLLGDGNVGVQAASGARIVGARDVGLDAFGVWSTDDLASAGADKHFDAIIDPAGWFDGGGIRVAGTWTDAQGLPADADGNFFDPLLGTRPIDPARDYFTPDAVNTDHRDFYGATLAGFVQAPGFVFEGRFAGRFRDAAGSDVFHARPGIELRNPDTAIRGGNIDVLSDWNLGAGSSESQLSYRYAGKAPVLTVRAAGNLNVSASLTDGFFQRSNVLEVATDISTANGIYFSAALGTLPPDYAAAPVELFGSDAVGNARYYGLYVTYANYLLTPTDSLGGQSPASLYQQQIDGASVPVEGAPVAPNPPADPARYNQYLAAYKSYLGGVYAFYANSGTLPQFVPLTAPEAVPTPSLKGAVTDNSPSPVRGVDNPLPLQSATLMSGPSTSYRLTAGARFDSTDPLAVHADAGDAASGSVVIDGHVRDAVTVQLYDGFGSTVQKDALLPTMIRTGTGRIDIAAGADVRLADALAPGVIYAAGRQSPEASFDPTVLMISPGNPNPALPTNGVNQPVEGGAIRIAAGRDLVGNQALFFAADGSINGSFGGNYAQYWAPWTQTSNTATQTGINFSGFDQGVLSVGGNIALSAGRDIVEFSASSPTTYTLATAADGSQTATVHGGGDLSVATGRDILSGTYFVSKGHGDIIAGGRIGSAFTLGPFDAAPTVSGDVSTLVALQDGQVSIHAAQGVDLGGIYNPDAIYNDLYAPISSGSTTPRSHQAYSSDSSVTVASLAGDIRYGSVKTPNYLFAFGGTDRSIVQDPLGGSNDYALGSPMALPASLQMSAFGGGITVERAGLLTGSQATLELVARDTVRIFDDVGWSSTLTTFFGVGPQDALGFAALPATSPAATAPLAPVRIYSTAGDIIDGRDAASGSALIQQLQIVADRPASIRAARDIVGLWFRGQNNDAGDTTVIVAGRDLYDAALANIDQRATVDIELGGPGTLLVEAGRNVGPFNRLDEAVSAGITSPVSGIKTIGNAVDPRLPIGGADMVVLYGVAPGMDLQGFEQRYIDPAATLPSGVASYASQLIAFVQRQQGSSAAANLSAADAYTALQALPEDVQKVFVQQVFLDLLKQTGIQYNDPASPQYRQYAGGFEAIGTLFPAKLGYTANSTNGNNGAEITVATGDLDLRGSTLQTQSGGNVSLLGPGGQALIGSTAAAAVVVDSTGTVVIGPNQTGILTLKTGSISSFSDRSILLAQSRIFTEQGGDILLWSSNGDVNAGKGAKTSADTPTPLYICTPDNYCRVDAAGQVTGAGIATLQTVPGAPSGNAVLVAPRGTVDAGDAGIRVTGNLIIAAQAVANADNVQVSGATVGVPSSRVDTGALAAAGGTAAAAQAQADALTNRRPAEGGATMITVDVIGFGAPDEEQKKRMRRGQ